MNADWPRRAAEAPYTSFVNVKGQRLWTSIQGKGESVPLLLIMGFGGNLELWRPFRRALGPYETIAFDLPGMGRSPVARRPLRARAVADLVLGLLDELGYDQVDVLGVSMGGGLAQQLAHQAPHRVRKLILCATTVGAGGLPGDPRVLLPLLNPVGAARFISQAMRGFYTAQRSDPELRADLLRFMRTSRPSGYASLAQLYAVTGWTSLPWVRSLHLPTLVMAGDDDHVVPPFNSRLLNRLIKGSRLYTVKGGGHLFLGFQAGEAAGVIREFLTATDVRFDDETKPARARGRRRGLRVMGCGLPNIFKLA